MPWQRREVSEMRYVTNGPGVYALFCGTQLWYIGQSEHIRQRVLDHLRNGTAPGMKHQIDDAVGHPDAG